MILSMLAVHLCHHQTKQKLLQLSIQHTIQTYPLTHFVSGFFISDSLTVIFAYYFFLSKHKRQRNFSQQQPIVTFSCDFVFSTGGRDNELHTCNMQQPV